VTKRLITAAIERLSDMIEKDQVTFEEVLQGLNAQDADCSDISLDATKF
jgi:hypothetical protein